MSVSKALLVVVVPLLLYGCCCMRDECPKRRPLTDHGEGPLVFSTADDLPGVGYVFGTADFGANGAVLVKIQIEDYEIVNAQALAEFEIWVGDGTMPADAAQAQQGTRIYESHDEVPLRYWTNHLYRQRDPAQQYFWIAVRVAREPASGSTPIVHWLAGSFDSQATSPPIDPLDFDFIANQ